jgi:hypothetical protein
MAFLPSDAVTRLERIRESIRSGNWDGADSMARELDANLVPQPDSNLEAYLKALRETLVLAKATRSNSIATLSRVRAAATFHLQRDACAGDRQNPDDPAGSCHLDGLAGPLSSES